MLIWSIVAFMSFTTGSIKLFAFHVFTTHSPSALLRIVRDAENAEGD